MATVRFFGTARDGEGNVIKEATVIIYDAGTTDTSTIYSDQSASTQVTGAALETDTDGSWECYISDGDYNSGQLFKVIASKTTYITKTDDYVGVAGF